MHISITATAVDHRFIDCISQQLRAYVSVGVSVGVCVVLVDCVWCECYLLLY